MRNFLRKPKPNPPVEPEEPQYLPSKLPNTGESMHLDMPSSGDEFADKRGHFREKKPTGKPIVKYVVVVILVVALAGVGVWKMLGRNSSKGASNKTGQTAQAGDKNPKRIRLLVAGDFIAHDSVNTAAHQSDGTYNYSPLMKDFVPVFKKADIRFCNDPILNGGAQFGITGYPTFNSPTEFVTDMGKLGCNVVNTASNHSFDKNQEVITASVNAWKKVPGMLAVAGQNSSPAEHDTVHYFTVKGVKFAFLAYTTYSNSDAPAQNAYGVNIFSKEFATAQVKEARAKGAQIIITSIRWGTEYSADLDAEQTQTAQFLASQGVDLVLGHGSHILQPVEELDAPGGKKTTVWYSIGNFLNSQIPPETVFNGLPVIEFDTSTKEITGMRLLPTYMHYEWTAAQAKAEDLVPRHNLHMYLLENATQAMVDAQQLHTTIPDQKQRLTATLTKGGLQIPLITSDQL